MTEQNERLPLLRAELARQGLSFLLVPRADEYQLPYPPPDSERLPWITGFTGSAGLAVIGKERAALFVDGRYTQQAKRQAPPPVWEQQHLLQEPPERWLEQAVSAGDVVGFDPRLHTPAGVNRYRDAVTRAKGQLRAVQENPVDRVWANRPAPPMGRVELYPDALAGKSARAKIDELAQRIAGQGADAAVVSDPTILMWLLNIRGSDTATVPVALARAIVRRDASLSLYIAPEKLGPEVRSALEALGTVSVAASSDFGAGLEGLLRLRVLVDEMVVNQWTLDRLKVAGATAVLGPDPSAVSRACKSEPQLEGIRAAHRRDAVALVRFLEWFEKEAPGGQDEWTVAQKLDRFRAESEHFRGVSFRTISAAGPSSALPHYTVTPEIARPLRDGEVFLVDSGAQYLDGTTDVTRVVIIGAPTAEMRRRYTQVLKGHIALGTARFPLGTTGSQLDALARLPLWADGVDFDHGTGHGVGAFLAVHEGPQSISKRPSSVALEPGMVVSNEPGYYKAGSFGIRIENLVAVEVLEPQPEGAEAVTLGFETLTLVPYARGLMERALLTDPERTWIDAYHARVREVLTPLLAEHPSTIAWLADATRPLP